jgi:hypothetical protein
MSLHQLMSRLIAPWPINLWPTNSVISVFGDVGCSRDVVQALRRLLRHPGDYDRADTEYNALVEVERVEFSNQCCFCSVRRSTD